MEFFPTPRLLGPPPVYLALESIRIFWRFLATELETNVQNFESIGKCSYWLHSIIIMEEGLQIKDYNEKMRVVEPDDILGQQ